MQQARLRGRLPQLAIVITMLALALGIMLWLGLPLEKPSATATAGLRQRLGTDTERLIAVLQSHLRTVPDDGQAYSQLGLAYLQRVRETGNPAYYPKAEAVLQRALALQPDDYLATGAMGALALARHDFATALEWGERALRSNPNRTYAYGVIADAQIELGRCDQAVETLQTLVDRRPNPVAFARISYLRELYGDREGALDMMRRAANGGGSNPENAAWFRTQLGNLYFNQGDLVQAAGEYEQVLAALPGYVYALAGLGRVRFAQDRPTEALALLTQAAQTIPLPEFVITLGDLYQALGQPEAARRQYDLVRAIQRLYQANGVDLDLEMALFAADHERAPQATVDQARAAYGRRPGIQAADVLAWALYQAGDYQEAQHYSDQSLRLGSQDALKFFHAGMIALGLGDSTKAIHDLERALSLNPHFSIPAAAEARAVLRELRVATRPTGGNQNEKEPLKNPDQTVRAKDYDYASSGYCAPATSLPTPGEVVDAPNPTYGGSHGNTTEEQFP